MSNTSLDNIQLPKDMDYVFNKTTRKIDEILKEAPIKIVDGNIICCGEQEDSFLWFDYYGEYRGGCMWVNEKLETWAKENFGKYAYWEWENNSRLSLCID